MGLFVSGQETLCGGKHDNPVLTAAFLIVQPGAAGGCPRGLEVRDMSGRGVGAEAPVLSALMSFVMIVASTVSIALPLALAIILICS